MDIRIAIAQMNSLVGDYQGNIKKIKNYIDQACENKADIIVFPEMCINGYPPEDLLLKTQFLKDSLKSIKEIASFSVDKDIVIILGAVECDENYDIFNSAQIIFKGNLVESYRKRILSSLPFFDERRYFKPGEVITLIELKGTKIGITIGDEIHFQDGSFLSLIDNKVDLILNLSASPFYKRKINLSYGMLKTRAVDLASWILYCNMVGGQDELVFDGGSIVVNPYGVVEINAPLFEEGLYFVDINPDQAKRAKLKYKKKRTYF